MRVPVCAADGMTYEADALKQWRSSRGGSKSPLTREPWVHIHLTPNLTLRNAIVAVLEVVGRERDESRAGSSNTVS